MNKLIYIIMAGFAVSAIAAAPPRQTPDAGCGSIERHRMYSPQLGDTVTVDVWLPAGYDAERERRYPVVFMHDGQNLHDATTTWNGQAWEVDSVASALIAAGTIDAPVVVGVYNEAEKRVAWLTPQKALGYTGAASDTLMQFFKGAVPRGDDYAAFVTRTLRPEILKIYNVASSADETFVMGSSMGGLMSVYMHCEYPDVYGGAGCLSTHWVGALDGNPAFPLGMLSYLNEKLPRDGRHKLYFDHGTETLDSLYAPWEERVLSLVDSLGYKRPATLSSYVDKGAAHEERYWMRRLHLPLTFLLPPVSR